jgi:hypothetical protein
MVKLRPKVRLVALAAFAVAVLVGVMGTTATTHLVQAGAAAAVLATSDQVGVFFLIPAFRTAAGVTSAAVAAAVPGMADTAVSAAVAAADTRTTFPCLAETAALEAVVEG